MTDVQRWDLQHSKRTGVGKMVQRGHGKYVLASDAEAAITAAEQKSAREMLHAELRWQADEAEIQRTTFQDGVEQGQRDMLAKCIAAVEKEFGLSLEPPWVGEVIDALRALQEKP